MSTRARSHAVPSSPIASSSGRAVPTAPGRASSSTAKPGLASTSHSTSKRSARSCANESRGSTEAVLSRQKPRVERCEREERAAHVAVDVEKGAIDLLEVASAHERVLVDEQRRDESHAEKKYRASAEPRSRQSERADGHDMQRGREHDGGARPEPRRGRVKTVLAVEALVLQAVENIEPSDPGEHGEHQRED